MLQMTPLALMLSRVVEALQTSIGPVILISGVGLLMLSLTNRYGRVIDRARVLGDKLRSNGADCGHLREQISILRERAKLLRTTITWASMSVLSAALLMIGTFIGYINYSNPAKFIVFMFCTCMISLIISIACFITDVNRSLAALDLDMQEAGGGDDE